MLLQQLASIFLCSQFPPPPDVQKVIGLQCTQEGCMGFLKCHAPSENTCSCFLHKEAKAESFSCPRKKFVLSEYGNSPLPEATRFSCLTHQSYIDVTLTREMQAGDSVTIIGKLTSSYTTSFRFTRNLWVEIQHNLDKLSSTNGSKNRAVAKNYPFKLGRKFEMKLLIRQNGYEVLVDGKRMFPNTFLALGRTQIPMNRLAWGGNPEIKEVSLNYSG